MSSGTFLVVAHRAATDGTQFRTREFAGDSAGLSAAIAFCGSNGVVWVYPSSGGLPAIPTAPAGVRINVYENGQFTEYGAAGLITAVRNIREFGAFGNNSNDDAAAIQAAHDALPTNGGMLVMPPGLYRIGSTLNFSKRIVLQAASGSVTSASVTPGCAIVKNFTGTAIILTGDHSDISNLVVTTVSSNGGDGIQIKANSVALRSCAVLKQGGVGIRIGHSDSTNCNIWYLDHVTCRENVGDGLYIHSDDSSSNMNANSGTAIACSLNQNGGKGLRLKNGSWNKFVGLHSESNTGEGIYLEGQADSNIFDGGDQEANNGSFTAVQINISASTCNDNVFFYTQPDALISDSGTRTKLYNKGYFSMPTFSNEIASSKPGPAFTFSIAGTNSGTNFQRTSGSFIADGIIVGRAVSGGGVPAGTTVAAVVDATNVTLSSAGTAGSQTLTFANEAYLQLYADATGRIRIGWNNGGPYTGLVPAQILADSDTLYLVGRDTSAGKVKLMGGSALAGYLLLDRNNGKLETAESLALIASSNNRGFIEMGELSSDAAAPSTNHARIYLKDTGGKTELVVRFPTGAVQPIAIEP